MNVYAITAYGPNIERIPVLYKQQDPLPVILTHFETGE